MNRITRKLILSVSACAMTAVCLTSTTYAWFARNSDAWVDNFKLEIGKHDGLVISVDGNNYYNAINNTTLFKAIASKRLNKEINEVTDDDILSVENSILEPVSTYDLVNFSTVNLNSKIEEGYYVPDKASKNTYLEFDLYFRIDQSKVNNDKNYYLTFAYDDDNTTEETKVNGYSYIKGVSESFKLSNSLSTPTKDYESGEEIKVNSGDAMRVGVLKSDNEALIYEPNTGIGSYALENETNDLYNPNKNAMFTYFNNTHADKLKPLEDISIDSNKTTFDVYKNTIKSFNNKDNLGTFKKNEKSYDDVKITVFIWLEGYDSDFIKGLNDNNIACYLNFMKEEYNDENA